VGATTDVTLNLFQGPGNCSPSKQAGPSIARAARPWILKQVQDDRQVLVSSPLIPYPL